jgi:hypothetical protein
MIAILLALAAVGGVAYVATKKKKPANAASVSITATKSGTQLSVTSNATPKSGQQIAASTQVQVPAPVLAKIAEALALGDPKKLEDLADGLDNIHAYAFAEQLRVYAAERRAAQQIDAQAVRASEMASPGFVPPPNAPPPQLPTVNDFLQAASAAVPLLSQQPPTVTAAVPSPAKVDPVVASGIALVAHLKSVPRYSENRTLVKSWQTLAKLTADGMYGPTSAKTLATTTGLVVPVPFYWSKATSAAQKADYTAFIKTRASLNPAQAAEWLAQIPKVQAS